MERPMPGATTRKKCVTEIPVNGMDGDDTATDKSDHKPPEKVCKQCNAIMVLQSTLGRFGDQPAYQIFQCSQCGYTDWVEVR
jgi:DNA-directed RNA polymerase subunit M/transcription elongation factor TFIIS